MKHLGLYEELFKSKDSLMGLLANCLATYNSRHKYHTLAKTFLIERLQHLLEYNLLKAYFKAASLMPLKALKEAPHTQPAFFTRDRLAYMIQHQDSLEVYFNQLGREFNLAFKEACERGSTARLIGNLGLFPSVPSGSSSHPSEEDRSENRGPT